MTEREDSDQPRKRIPVACGRCRKRKIRCSGDTGNGGPCSNCKNAGYEPCLFLRVSSQETPLKDTNDYTYNLDAARTYAQSRGAVSPLSPLPQYAHELAAGDGLASYRQSPYSYNSKGYYQTMPGWAGAYQDDGGVDYSLNYSSYQIINQEPAPVMSGYGPYSGRKSLYVDAEAPTYSYGNLVHRPAVNSDGQGFSLSSMAASLPSASDRLHSSVNRTLTSSSNYRTDSLPGSYPPGKSSSSATSMPDVAYGNLQPSFEPTYPSSGALASAIAHRATAHADAAYPTGAAAATEQQLYASNDPSIGRAGEDGGAGLSYVYSDSKLGSSRRESHQGGGVGAGPLLSNGHIYVPESHAAHAAPHGYVVPSAPSSSAQARGGIDGGTLPVGADGAGTGRGGGSRSSVSVNSNSNNSSNISSSSNNNNGGISSGGGSGSGGSGSSGGGTSHRPSDSHRRSAGSLRGG
ncbi:hypothetical protein F4802DRAFT_602813 [Xylaria palmicola]|nr:hypothetical protein F4802DRAFT_602813 [Xylaria palmicola]